MSENCSLALMTLKKRMSESACAKEPILSENALMDLKSAQLLRFIVFRSSWCLSSEFSMKSKRFF